MSKLNDIKRQIAALEARAARLIEQEMDASVAKVKALMHSLGVTVEHLGTSSSKTVKRLVEKSAPKKATAKRAGAGTVKYRDPKTGATWTGFGRAPGWIASAKSRDKFLIEPPAAASDSTKPAAAQKAKPAAKKAARVAKKATAKVARKAGASVKAAVKKVVRSKASATKAPVKPAPAKKAAPRKRASKVATAPAAEAGSEAQSNA